MSNPIDPKALAEAQMLYRSFGFDEHVLIGALAAVFEQRDTLTAQVETLRATCAERSNKLQQRSQLNRHGACCDKAESEAYECVLDYLAAVLPPVSEPEP